MTVVTAGYQIIIDKSKKQMGSRTENVLLPNGCFGVCLRELFFLAIPMDLTTELHKSSSDYDTQQYAVIRYAI